MPIAPTQHDPISACTIITRCYLSQARSLARSFNQHEPKGKFYLFIVDGLPDGVEVGANVTLLTFKDLELPYLDELLFKYGVVEFCTAIKPSLLLMLMQKYGEKRLAYIDPDIMLFRPMTELSRALNDHAIVLTPHTTRPIPLDDAHPSDQDILMAGAYNLGFIGLRHAGQVEDLLKWWEERLRDGCRIDPATGLMTDQKWIDLVPGMFSSTHILRDETYNVAYWNISSRRVLRCGNQYLVNARPLTFFHFSNFNPEDPLAFSRDHGRERAETGSGLAELLQLYAQEQIEQGYQETRTWKFQARPFDNGIPVGAAVKRFYLSLDRPTKHRFANPFETAGDDSLFHWMRQPSGAGGLSPFLLFLYRDRIDLQGAYPDVEGADREKFLEWAQTTGPSEVGYDAELAMLGEGSSAIAGDGDYQQMVERIRSIVRESLPPDAPVSVISKGDPRLLQLDGRPSSHFPRGNGGEFAGHYPESGEDALNHLREHIDSGSQFLVIPQTSMWWLDHYEEFGRALSDEFTVVMDEPETCRIFALAALPEAEEDPEVKIDALLQSRAEQVAQLLYENRHLKDQLRDYQLLLHGKLATDGTRTFWNLRDPQPTSSYDHSGLKQPTLVEQGDIHWLSHNPSNRLVSVILSPAIPDHLVKPLVRSIYAQTNNDRVEVILFDDETDRRGAMLNENERTSRIKLPMQDYRWANRGMACNLAAEHARGEILIFIADSVFPVNETLVSELIKPLDDEPTVAAVCCGFEGAVKAESFHDECVAVRAHVFRQIPFSENPLHGASQWTKILKQMGFEVRVQPKALIRRAEKHSSALQSLIAAIQNGSANGNHPATSEMARSNGDPAMHQAASELGKLLGNYLDAASPQRRID
jgi:hypothetical protein